MLTPEQISSASESIAPIYQDLEDNVIRSLSAEFKKAITDYDAIESTLKNAADIGINLDDVMSELRKANILSQEQVSKILSANGVLNVYEENKRLAVGGLEVKAENYPFLRQIIEDYVDQTNKDLSDTMRINYTGFTMETPTGTKFFNTDAFVQQQMRSSALSVRAGIMTQDEAVESFIQKMSVSGLNVVYPSGYHCSVEAAAMRSIRTAVNAMAQRQNEEIANEIGLPYAEVTAHQGARPEHKVWQGKIYKIEGSEPEYPNLYEATGLGTLLGLCGVNCRHQWHGWDKGLPRTYTDEELENIDPPPIEYNGKEYTYYQATQKQRAFERAIRQTKREIAGYKGVGDSDKLGKANKRLKELENGYQDFSDAMNLKTYSDRTRIYKGTEPSFSSRKSMLKNYTDEEVIKISSEMDKVASNHISVASKWSGKTVIDNINNPGKLWNCDIRLKNMTSENIALHEHIHARSVSYFDGNIYVENSIIEESSVQLASREICKKEGFSISPSKYDNDVDLLSKAGKIIGYSDDYSFAMDLIQQELPTRIDWIRNKGYNTLNTIGDYNDLEDLLKNLEGSYDKRR